MVEETSAAARNLNSEVTALADRAAMFRVSGEVAGYKPRAAAPAPAPAPRTVPAAITTSQVAPVRKAAPVALATGQDDDWMDF